MPVGKVVNASIHKYPSEFERTEKLVGGDNNPPNKIVSPTPTATNVGGEMASQANLHKNFIRQGPQHRYDGDMEDANIQSRL